MSWYATDFMSHLHIGWEEDIVMILVKKDKYAYHKSLSCCNASDIYRAFGLPIHGKYDECGAVTEVKNVKDVLDFLNQFEYDIDEHSKDTFEFPLTAENLDKFLYSVSVDDVSVNDELLSCMYINENLYNALIDNYKNRTYENHGRGYTYEELIEKCCNRLLAGIEDDMNNASILKRLPDDPKDDTYFRFSFRDYLDEFRGLWITDSSIRNDDIIKYLMEKAYKNESIKKTCIEYVKELLVFHWVLESMRSGYLCISGSGGEMREMLLQKILAEYILARCTQEVAEYREENICDETDTDERILSDSVTAILYLDQ